MKKSSLLFVLCCLSGIMVSAQDWVTFTQSNPHAPVINLTQSDNLQVQYTVEVYGMFKENLTEEGESFQRIEIPGAGKLSETGEPELPYIRQLIAIPECDDVILTVNITGQNDFINYNIYPAPYYEEVQGPDSLVYFQEVFSKNETVYDQNNYLPGTNAEIVSMGYLRGQKYAEVYLYPVQFNPVTNHIIVYEYYQVSLGFSNPITDVNVNTGIFNNVAANTFINYISSGITASINDNVEGNGMVQWITLSDPEEADDIVADYLIICDHHFFQPENPFSEVSAIANHRATYNGYDVAILNADNVISDELNFYYEDYPETQYKREQRIRTCIRYIYEGGNALHTYDGRLGYVLLIGDSEYPTNSGMPTSKDNTYQPGPGLPFYPSDYYYSCVTKQGIIYDLTGDLFIGRFCVDNNLGNGLTELQNVVSKTIFYESEATFGGWRDETGVLLAIDSDYHPLYFGFMDNLVPSYFTVDKIDGFQGNVEEQLYPIMNEGTMTFTYFGHGIEDAWWTGNKIYTDDLITNLVNDYKAPVVHGIACHTGHFDASEDCLGEAMVTYSGTKGFTGYLGACRTVGYQFGPSISNPPTLFQELIPYTIFHDLSHITGEYILESKLINSSSSIQYKHAFNFFGDPALNIMAQGFEVTHDITLPLVATISTKITVRNGATLTIPEHGELRFENKGKLIFEEDATLNIMSNANLSAISGTDSLIVYGNLVVGNNVHFSAAEGVSFVIDIRNSDLMETLLYASFENIIFTGIANFLNFSSCDFTDSYIELHKIENNQYLFYQSDFLNTSIKACRYGMYTLPNVGNIVISGCDFINGSSLSIIEISGFPNFQVINTSLSYDQGDGIGLYYCGNAVGTTHKVSNCDIHFTGDPADDTQGIKVHYSRVDIENNFIHGNDIGLACLQRSSISLTGNSQSGEEDETQRIKDNVSVQIFSDGSSFPYEFEYNSIYNDIEDDYVVKMDNNIFTGYDIRYNYWGENFSPQNDLYPVNAYIYIPVWEPSWGSKKSAEADKVLFYAAKQAIVDSSYAEAKTKLKELIENYPGSKYQKAAVKEILHVTDLCDQDYTGLKIYLDSIPSLWEDDEISGITEYIIIWCDIRLQNYPVAISWFEDRILNPVSFADSILSIIDLGYVYSFMESGGSRWNGYTGKLPQYRPTSQKMYAAYREYLIDLLTPGQSNVGQDTVTTSADHTAGFIQTYPNPATDNQVTINYYLPGDAKVVVNIYNSRGVLIEKVIAAFQKAGEYKLNCPIRNLDHGVYFMMLKINGAIADCQKLVVVN